MPSHHSLANYRDIGTNIDVTASAAPDGRYRIAVTSGRVIRTRRATVPKATPTAGASPSARCESNNNVNLKDGQSIEFTAATDRLNGEVTRISLKLTVLN